MEFISLFDYKNMLSYYPQQTRTNLKLYILRSLIMKLFFHLNFHIRDKFLDHLVIMGNI